jgi:N-acetyl-gamma-glutamyl-phosphate reductase
MPARRSMPSRVFIDGEAGTTGLRIREHLAPRADVTVVSAPYEQRRDVEVRKALLNDVDLAILCLPDEAAREAVALVSNPKVKILDASSAHRTHDGWAYGFPELGPAQRDLIRGAARVSNPGCHATGFVASLRPLVAAGLIPADTPLAVNSLSGYSGGGKELIRVHEEELASQGRAGCALYGLELGHKHLPEMQRWSGLSRAPLFIPTVGNFRCGLVTSVPLQLTALPGSVKGADLHAALVEHYRGEPFVRVLPLNDRAALRAERYLDADVLNGTNFLELFVFAQEAEGQALIVARFDNLGKGASGAAVQNMNLMLGLPERAGLDPG